MNLSAARFCRFVLPLLVVLTLATPTPTWAKPALSATTNTLDLRALRVNELGVVPVLMYHAFTTNPTIDPYTRSLDDFLADLTWLYQHNFYVVSVSDLIANQIDIPAGKHPVVLTFDDSAARQFQFTVDSAGNRIPSPDSAMGVMEAFFSTYPDFGRGGHFAVVGQQCFAFKSNPGGTAAWEAECAEKLQWLSDHGYEVGNHTWSHQNLGLLDAAGFTAEVGANADFIDLHVTGPGNRSDILTLPYGVAPASGTLAEEEMFSGFTWSSRTYRPNAIIRVDHGMTPSPASAAFSPMAIRRINTDPAALADWFGRIERGEVLVYTSDGDVSTVAVHDPLPTALAADFDADLIAASGKTLVRFTDDGQYHQPPLSDLPAMVPGTPLVTAAPGVRLRERPSTAAPVQRVLLDRTPLRVLEGPITADGHTWWRVETEQAHEGWVVEDLLAGPPAT